MRQVILDTETTGLSWEKGNRVVEIGCVELIERRPSGRTFHTYLKPDCQFEPGAQEVTGLTLEFLADKPRFEDVAADFIAFIAGAQLIIHNAAFDVGFLDNELGKLPAPVSRILDHATVEDSLLMARQRFPGQRNSLDALCKRLGVDNTHRQLHGALLDAQLLCDVYLALTSGQREIGFATETAEAKVVRRAFDKAVLAPRRRVLPSEEEQLAHAARLVVLRKTSGDRVIWDAHDAIAAA